MINREITNFFINGEDTCPLFTENGILVAKGYKRLIYSGGKPYIEFEKNQLVLQNLTKIEGWQKKHPEALYKEYQTKDGCCRVHFQLRENDNRLPDMWYIASTSLFNKVPSLKTEEVIL